MKTTLKIPRLLLLGLVAAFLFACKAPMDMIEQGNYDKVISASLKKLRGKKKKKEKYVQGLELAFNRATERDVGTIKALRHENDPANWERIYTLFRQIERRQAKVRPLLPLVDKDGYQANFRFVKTTEAVAEAKREMVQHFYREAQRYLANAERGDKRAAREAHAKLVKIDKYYPNYKDKDALKARASAAGISHVVVEVDNRTGSVLPARFEADLLRFGVRDLDSRWQRYYLNGTDGIAPDYRVVISFTDIAVSPGEVRERIYTDEKEIDDGFDYVLDDNGNVLKDTSGNDIKIPRTKTIRADVLENYQFKNAAVSGRIDFYDAREGQLMHSEPIAAEAIFEHYAATFNGDQRALSGQSKRRIGNAPMPFPADEQLLLQAAERLKPVVKTKIKNNRLVY